MTNKYQPFDFRTVDELLEFLPSVELKIVERLRSLIFECVPDNTEKISYNVPFYKRRKNLCYIWPPSVPWGNIKITGVQFGFNQGYKMRDELNWLDRGTRKQVYWREFKSVKEIDEDVVRTYLFEAVRVDDLR